MQTQLPNKKTTSARAGATTKDYFNLHIFLPSIFLPHVVPANLRGAIPNPSLDFQLTLTLPVIYGN
jgi:hypothetical protein